MTVPAAWRTPATALLLAALAGCAGDGRFERFVGEVSPTPAVPGARCGGPTRGVLNVRGGRFAFAPTDGVLVIEGPVAQDGALEGSLPLRGGGAPRDGVLAFSGRRNGDRVDGTLREPRCTATVSLRRR